jgi:hypothetical protein
MLWKPLEGGFRFPGLVGARGHSVQSAASAALSVPSTRHPR